MKQLFRFFLFFFVFLQNQAFRPANNRTFSNYLACNDERMTLIKLFLNFCMELASGASANDEIFMTHDRSNDK